MMILNEDGWDGWTLPHPSMELLRQFGGKCQDITKDRSHSSLVDKATFLHWVGSGHEQVHVHKCGQTVQAVTHIQAEIQPNASGAVSAASSGQAPTTSSLPAASFRAPLCQEQEDFRNA